MQLLGLPAEQCPETWISLPPSRRPKWWDKIKDPVVRLEYNLYGHPLGGLLWERWLEEKLLGLGWELVPGWESLFVHYEKKAFLSVYVDDFKMAGRADNLEGLWKDISTQIDLDPPSPMNHQVYLGCNQHDVPPIPHLINDKQFMFKKLITAKVDSEETDGGGDLDQVHNAQSTLSNDSMYSMLSQTHELPPSTIPLNEVRAWNYEMIGHTEKAVEAYCKLANVSIDKLRPFETPCIDDAQLSQVDHEAVGELSAVGARIVFKALYVARLGRPDQGL